MDTAEPDFLDTLYSADATGYLALIREHGAAGSLLVIGHKPMMEDLSTALAAMISSFQAALARQIEHIATVQ